mmetsp:Transcript_74475/g.200816  ORF Transcript_74475/g.200816 Transcript_74475/m.200816 type:complete len:255 (-) Transcript_74475:153-917(-)
METLRKEAGESTDNTQQLCRMINPLPCDRPLQHKSQTSSHAATSRILFIGDDQEACTTAHPKQQRPMHGHASAAWRLAASFGTSATLHDTADTRPSLQPRLLVRPPAVAPTVPTDWEAQVASRFPPPAPPWAAPRRGAGRASDASGRPARRFSGRTGRAHHRSANVPAPGPTDPPRPSHARSLAADPWCRSAECTPAGTRSAESRPRSPRFPWQCWGASGQTPPAIRQASWASEVLHLHDTHLPHNSPDRQGLY